MTNTTIGSDTALRLRRIFAAPREKLFRAWTDPRVLSQWFAVAPGYTTPVAEVDLRVGGRYRLGMQPPEAEEVLVATGRYVEVRPPEKLAFTWRWEGPDSAGQETLVTIEFLARAGSTEVILTHERFADAAARDQHEQGWQGCLEQLGRLITQSED